VTRWVLLLAVLLVPATARGQALGVNELVAGAVLNVALRAPVVAKAWRRTVPRVALATVISVTYERFVDANYGRPQHDAWGDVRGRVAGYLVTEGALWLVRRVTR